MSQNEKGGPIRSVYSMSDMPIGTSVPYLPVARTRERLPPRLLGSADKTGRQGPAQTFAEDDDSVVHGATVLGTSMDVVPVTQRPSASVTEIPGASAQPMRINSIGSFKPSIEVKSLKTGAMSRELVNKTARIDGAGTSNFTVVLFPLLGLICPPFLLCGCRYLSSPSKVAKMLGALSIFMFVTYVMVGVIVFATLWKPDKWSGHISCAMIPYLEHRPRNDIRKPLK